MLLKNTKSKACWLNVCKTYHHRQISHHATPKGLATTLNIHRAEMPFQATKQWISIITCTVSPSSVSGKHFLASRQVSPTGRYFLRLQTARCSRKISRQNLTNYTKPSVMLACSKRKQNATHLLNLFALRFAVSSCWSQFSTGRRNPNC